MTVILTEKVIFCAVNRGAAATWTSGSVEPGLPAANLYDEQPSKPSRLQSNDPALTWYQADCSTPRLFGLFAGFNHSFTKKALWRVRCGSDPVFTQDLAPDAILTQTGLTGVLAAITEDPGTDNGSWLTAATFTTATTLAVSFPTPARSLLTGGPWCRVRVRLRKAGGATAPTLAIRIRESGVVRATVATGIPVTAATPGQVLSFTFDPGLYLTNLTGAPFEVELVATPSANATVEFGAVRWHCDLVGAVYDSKLLNVAERVNGFGTLPWGLFEWGAGLPEEEEVASLNTQFLHLPQSDIVARYHRVDFYDPENPNAFLDIGEYVFGPALRPSKNPTYGVELGPLGGGSSTRNPAGISYSDVSPVYQGLTMEFQGLREDEALTMQKDIDFRLGTSGGFVVVLFPLKPSTYRLTAFYCKQARMYPVRFAAYRSNSKRFELEQLL